MLRSLATLTFVLPLSFAVAQDEPTLAAPPKPSELPQGVPTEASDPAPLEPAAPPKPLIGVRERVALGLLRQFVPTERQRSFDNVVETLQEVAEQVDGVRGVGRTDVRPSGVVQAEARTRKPTRRQRRVQQNGQSMPRLGEPVDGAVEEIEQVAGRVQEDDVSLNRGKPAPAKVGPVQRTWGPSMQGILDSDMYKVDKDVQELLKRLETRLGSKEQLDDHGLPRFQNSHPTQPTGPVIRHGHADLSSNQNNAAIKKLLSERDHLRAMLDKARKAEADAKKLSAATKHKSHAETGHENPFRDQPGPGRNEHHDHADHDHADHEHSHESDHAQKHRGHDRQDAQRREHEARMRAEAMRRQHLEREHVMQREHEEFEHHVHELERETEIHRLNVARRELHLEQSHLRAESAADPLPTAIWAVDRVIELYGDDAARILRELQPKIRHEVVRRYVTMRLVEIAEDDREAAIDPLVELILDGDDRDREQRSSNNGR